MSVVDELRNELDEEIRWRIDEISVLKTIPYLYKVSEKQKTILEKYSIPSLYALWEGFVVKSFEIYSRKLNELSLDMENVHPNILTHDLDMKKRLKDGRVSALKQIEFTLDLKTYFSSEFKISGKVPTKSNVGFSTINNILQRFNLEKFEKREFKHKMWKLLKYRNDIAHGESSLHVDKDIVLEMSRIVIECMDKLYDILEHSIIYRTYLK
ncbi:MAG: MAE_28990/MAE_18760 family HEPN-like nuclease [Clostridia bacterium]|nr:MAE_28990/MAE_18760 family HEPN-like nuclease [Clostridia bacterium]